VVRSESTGNSFKDPRFKEISVKLWDPGTRVSKLSFWPFFTYSSSLDPETTRFKLVPIFGFSLFTYDRNELEKDYSLITFIKFGSGPEGDLQDVTDTGKSNDE
jgi:hypothetical protein